MDINVTVSPFVPKPHTPFQMERQMGRDYFTHMLRRIKQGLPRSVKIKNHDVESSILEAVIARGDARLGEVIDRSYHAGCRFDSWEEHFRCDIWRKNLDDILPGWERCLGRRSGGPMPWHVIETGFERLIEKRNNESAAGALPHMRKVRPIEPIEASRIEEAKLRFSRRFKVTNRIRIRFSKTGMMRFIPHIDFMEIVKRALRMAGAPVAMSQGFNKRERMSAGFPTPLGIESESELVDVELFDDIIKSFPDALGACLPDEIGVAGVRAVDEQTSLMAATNVVEYHITTASEPMGLLIRNGLASRPEFIKHSKKNDRSIPFDKALHSFEIQNDGSLVLRLHAGSEDSVRIDDALRIITGIEGGNMKGIRIVKIAQYRIIDNSLTLIY
jgi:radical SAM-linked protein